MLFVALLVKGGRFISEHSDQKCFSCTSLPWLIFGLFLKSDGYRCKRQWINSGFVPVQIQPCLASLICPLVSHQLMYQFIYFFFKIINIPIIHPKLALILIVIILHFDGVIASVVSVIIIGTSTVIDSSESRKQIYAQLGYHY